MAKLKINHYRNIVTEVFTKELAEFYTQDQTSTRVQEFFNTDAHELIEYYVSKNDFDGKDGAIAEVAIRERLTGKIAKMSPNKITDIVVKSGVTVEVKTGQGWIIPPQFESENEAWAFYHGKATRYKMARASHVVYIPVVTKESIMKAKVIKQADFMRLLESLNLVRVKKSRGLYGIAIQQYLPTEKFKPSKERVAVMRVMLEVLGESQADFVARMKA